MKRPPTNPREEPEVRESQDRDREMRMVRDMNKFFDWLEGKHD